MLADGFSVEKNCTAYRTCREPCAETGAAKPVFPVLQTARINGII